MQGGQTSIQAHSSKPSIGHETRRPDIVVACCRLSSPLQTTNVGFDNASAAIERCVAVPSLLRCCRVVLPQAHDAAIVRHYRCCCSCCTTWRSPDAVRQGVPNRSCAYCLRGASCLQRAAPVLTGGGARTYDRASCTLPSAFVCVNEYAQQTCTASTDSCFETATLSRRNVACAVDDCASTQCSGRASRIGHAWRGN